MSDGTSPTESEKLRPVDPAATRVQYRITISRVTTWEAHTQTWQVVGRDKDNGNGNSPLRERMGYVTTVQKLTANETVFDAVASVMPSLVALAKLVEPGGE